MTHRLRSMLLVVTTAVAPCVACAHAPAPTTETATSSSHDAPCAPSDCPPCDLTKSKCTGPMVCDGHPEKAKTVCERNADGVCAAKTVCE